MTVRLAIRVTLRSAKPGIGGWRAGVYGREELEFRVAETPADGAANEAAVTLIAEAFGISRSEVSIISGHASRHKRLAIPLSQGEIRGRPGNSPGKE